MFLVPCCSSIFSKESIIITLIVVVLLCPKAIVCELSLMLLLIHDVQCRTIIKIGVDRTVSYSFLFNSPIYFCSRFRAFSCIAAFEQRIDICSLNFSVSSMFKPSRFMEVVVVISLLHISGWGGGTKRRQIQCFGVVQWQELVEAGQFFLNKFQR